MIPLGTQIVSQARELEDAKANTVAKKAYDQALRDLAVLKARLANLQKKKIAMHDDSGPQDRIITGSVRKTKAAPNESEPEQRARFRAVMAQIQRIRPVLEAYDPAAPPANLERPIGEGSVERGLDYLKSVLALAKEEDDRCPTCWLKAVIDKALNQERPEASNPVIEMMNFLLRR